MLPSKQWMMNSKDLQMKKNSTSVTTKINPIKLTYSKLPIIVGTVVSLLSVTACNSSDDKDEIVQPNSVVGVWFGQATTLEGENEDVVIAISPEGKTVLFAETTNNMFITNATVSENSVTSEDTMYYPADNMTRNGAMHAMVFDASLDGAAIDNAIEFTAQKIVLQNTITLTDVTGNYSIASPDNDYVRTFAIDSDGFITGSDTVGCVYSGSVEPIDGVNALFNVSINVESCFENFEYQGLLAYGTFPFNYDGGVNERPGIVVVTEDQARAYAIRQFSVQN